MQFAWSKCLMAAAMVMALLVFSPHTYAQQSVSSNGYTFTATLIPTGVAGQYQLTYVITNVSGQTADPYNWSLTLFSNGDTITGNSGLSVTTSYNNTDYASGYTVNVGKSNNGNANCNGTLSDAICVEQSGTGSTPTIAQGESVTFTFDITCSGCTTLSSWDFLSSGNCVTGSGNCYAVSAWSGSTSMPEPSNLVLYAATFLAFGTAFVWWNRKRSDQRTS